MSRTAAKFTQADVARSEPQSVVYFVEIGKHIKIGFTTNLKQRLKSFLTSTPNIELLLAIPGERSLEKLIHEKLAECCIARELFEREWRVLSFIRHYENDGLDAALKFLEETDPAARAKQRADNFTRRVAEKRKSRIEKNAYFASLVAERKTRLGW